MQWVGEPRVLGGRAWQPLLVTIAVFGQQFAWGVEQAYVSLVLLDLGLSKAALSLVWLLGPLCGLIVNPATGVLTDHWASPRGRRRPVLIAAAVTAAIGLFGFAWARDIAAALPGHVPPAVVATAAVLLVDIAINACGAAWRALVVDVFPARRQRAANSWAGRMSAAGHLGSYLLGAADVTRLGFGTQVKGVCALSAAVLLASTLVTFVAVRERVLVALPPPTRGFGRRLRDLAARLLATALHLDKQLAAIFRVQLFGWYAWFTFMFFGATWGAEVWRSETGSDDPDATARAGARLLVVFAVSATVFSVVLPRLPIDMTALWGASYVIYAVAVLATGWIHSYWAAVAIAAVIGLPWAMTIWAPFALTSVRIHQLPATPDEASDEDGSSVETHLSVVSDSSVGVRSRADAETIDGVSLEELDDEVHGTADSGLYLGLHNCAITLPQFLSTFCSFVVFRVLSSDPAHPHEDGGRAIAVSLQLGSIAAAFAAFYAYKVRQVQRAGAFVPLPAEA